MSVTVVQGAIVNYSAYIAGFTYAAGSYCSYGGIVYYATTQITDSTPGPSSSYWQPVTVDVSQFGVELANATAVSGQQTGITVTTDVIGAGISVPVSTRPVYLSGEITAIVTSGAAATTYCGMNLVEIPNGVDTPLSISALTPLPGANVGGSIAIPPYRLASSTARVRQFKLQIVPAGCTVTVISSTTFPSWITAEAK